MAKSLMDLVHQARDSYIVLQNLAPNHTYLKYFTLVEGELLFNQSARIKLEFSERFGSGSDENIETGLQKSLINYITAINGAIKKIRN